jgi:arsenate reductase
MATTNTIKIWHNNRCSTSRAAMAYLETKGIQPEVRHYLEQPPTEKELRTLLKKLKLPASGLVRKKEPLYKELFGDSEPTEDALIAAMVEHPVLIERPVIISGRKAVIGRPVEAAIDRLLQ